jgi:micrococcal nuclease
MGKYFFLILTVIFFIFTGCNAKQEDLYLVTKVVDGDTIKVNINGQEETIRLLLIDTPETVHPHKPVQPYGPEASAFIKQLLDGKKVRLELGISERDKYGRLLAYVYTENGKMVNKLLLEEGLARVAYIYQPNTKYLEELQAIQKKAQELNKGIWSIENYDDEDSFEGEELTGDCLIKGNINTKGEKIYHVPTGSYYERTKAEEMFCTEAEAKKAGYRKAMR